MPTYNCTNCGLKHGTNDSCGRGERTKRDLRRPMPFFGSERSRADALW